VPRRPRRLLILAAGGLLWRSSRGGPELALVHRPRHRDWSLPKGKRERGEGLREAALREVFEETNCRPRLLGFAGFTLYRVGLRPKLVLFWHMTVERRLRFEPTHEVDRVEWLTPRDALRRLDHAGERRIVRRARAPAELTAGAR
jgi:8-oxo-dGTP diphosphatase